MLRACSRTGLPEPGAHFVEAVELAAELGSQLGCVDSHVAGHDGAESVVLLLVGVGGELVGGLGDVFDCASEEEGGEGEEEECEEGEVHGWFWCWCCCWWVDGGSGVGLRVLEYCG